MNTKKCVVKNKQTPCSVTLKEIPKKSVRDTFFDITINYMSASSESECMC